MPWPSDIVIRNRRGKHKNRFAFVCGRNGHKYVRKMFRSEGERETYIHKHDELLHFEEFTTVAQGVNDTGATLAELIEGYGKHMTTLVERGARNQRSIEWYERTIWPPLLEGLGAHFVPSRVNKAIISGYITWRFANAPTTNGAVIIKELKALQTLLRWAEIPFAWKVPLDEIRIRRPKKKAKKKPVEVTPEVIGRLLRAMRSDSLEYAVSMTKLLTGMRTVEVLDLRVGQIDFRHHLIHYTLKSKINEYEHIAYITPDLAKILKVWAFQQESAAGRTKGKDDHVFLIETAARGRAAGRGIPKVRPLTDRTLRKRLIRASEAATPPIDPPIENFKHFRHEAITAALASLTL